jgi:hypothetical protein
LTERYRIVEILEVLPAASSGSDAPAMLAAAPRAQAAPELEPANS